MSEIREVPASNNLHLQRGWKKYTTLCVSCIRPDKLCDNFGIFQGVLIFLFLGSILHLIDFSRQLNLNRRTPISCNYLHLAQKNFWMFSQLIYVIYYESVPAVLTSCDNIGQFSVVFILKQQICSTSSCLNNQNCSVTVQSSRE